MGGKSAKTHSVRTKAKNTSGYIRSREILTTKARRLNPKELQRKRARQQEVRTTIFAAERKRSTTLSNKPGYRALSILTLEPDNFIPNERQGDIMRERHRNRIRIAAIQETHIPQCQSYVENGYRAITTAERKTNSANIIKGMYQGGVSILVREDMQRQIKQIGRIGRGILKIIL